MNFIKQLFSAPKMASTVVDAVIKSGDALVFTDEEKDKANHKRLEWLLKFHEASSGSSVARRLLSLGVTGVFLLLALASAGLVLAGSERVGPMLTLVGAFHLPELVGGVWLFYFGHRMLPGRK